MKKLFLFLIILMSFFAFTNAAPIVELAAPRNSGTGISFDTTNSNPQPTPKQNTQASSVKTKTTVNSNKNVNKNTKSKNNSNSKYSSKNKSKSSINSKKSKYKKNTSKKTAVKSKTNINKNAKTNKPAVSQNKQIPAYNYNNIYKMLEYGYYQSAEQILNQELAKNPNNINAQALYVILLAKQNKLDIAQEKLDDLIKKYPDCSDLYYAQGLINYQRTKSSNMLYRGNSDVLLENAYNDFKKSVELNPNNAMSLNAIGVIELLSGNIVSAKKYFQQSYDADNTYANAIDNLGTVDMIENNLEDAETKFNNALSFNKSNPLVLYHLSQLYAKREDFQTALKYLAQAQELDPNAPYIFNLYGKIYHIQGNDAAAIDSYKKSIMSKPEFLVSYLDLSQIYQNRGDAEFALAQLKTALNIKADSYDVKMKIADISYANGKYDQAIDFYNSLIGIKDYNDDALKGLANAYFAKAQSISTKSIIGSNSEIYKALDYVNKAIEANGNDLELYLAKLKLTGLTNQPEKSRMILENIVKADGDSLIDLVVKGEAYLTLYDFKNANRLFNVAIDKSSTLKDDLYLAEIFMYHKQFIPAMKVLDKIITNNPGHQEALNDLDYIAKCKKYSINYEKSAKAFAKSHNYSSAIEYYKRSLAINPNNAQARFAIAKLYEKQKEDLDALNNYRAFVGLTPDDKKDSRKVQKVIKKIRKIENKFL